MNRIVGKCYIVDSAGLWLTHDSSGTGNFLDFDIQSANFVCGTSGNLEIVVESDTAASSVIRMFNPTSSNPAPLYWPKGLCIEQRMFVKTCVSGTGYLYFS